MQTSTLNPTVVYAAHVGEAVTAFCAAPVGQKDVYQCDVRQDASYFRSIGEMLFPFALAPHSTTRCSLEHSSDQAHDDVSTWQVEAAPQALLNFPWQTITK